MARRVVQMAVARSLVASAQAKARAGDPAAWEHLHAVWNLARSLDGQRQMMEQTAALAMVRMINAVAWKLPLPVPAWLGELQERDPVRPLIEAFQYSAASYWEDEATANALRVREGKPIETGSRCSDGGWKLDGTTLRFSREIATAAPDRSMPLVLRVKDQ